jgi:hypothetical protein
MENLLFAQRLLISPPPPVRKGAVSRILHSKAKIHTHESTEYRHYISLHGTAGFDDQS